MDPIFGKLLLGAFTGALEGAFAQPGNINVSTIAHDAVQRVTKDPVVTNQMNAEPLHQSRVVVGSTIGMIGAIFVAGDHLITMWQSGVVDIAMASAEIATIWGLGFALYGRIRSGLKPLFAK